ncbi:hypothetical protein TNIN_18081 [Trichonephila inaurata madagascariensis]|uniref:Uncharacterized protein n=1 Tax=Trichonephila inaurata madagascariensis TaxID=2747483 RepID=A0A8X6X612_9ARAC|nr:hypothetical protein TNIN_18081 [Trichonephila inaurata madagascariensis]
MVESDGPSVKEISYFTLFGIKMVREIFQVVSLCLWQMLKILVWIASQLLFNAYKKLSGPGAEFSQEARQDQTNLGKKEGPCH